MDDDHGIQEFLKKIRHDKSTDMSEFEKNGDQDKQSNSDNNFASKKIKSKIDSLVQVCLEPLEILACNIKEATVKNMV